MHKAMFTKILSISISLAVLISSCPVSGRAIGMPEAVQPGFLKALTPPPSLGTVVSSSDAGGAVLPRLIVIADLHGQIDVQNSIIGMLEGFVNHLTSPKNAMA